MAKDEDVSSGMKRKAYEQELRKLQVQLCHLQESVKEKKLRVIVLFEGRDAAGKGARSRRSPSRSACIPGRRAPRAIRSREERRFKARIDDPLRQWKLSRWTLNPTGAGMIIRWRGISCSRRQIQKHAPWHVIRSDHKRRARLNCIAHLLKAIPFKKVSGDRVRLPKRSDKGRYNDQAPLRRLSFVAERY
jgi:polyphosphate kinase 2 (PPK2 family)